MDLFDFIYPHKKLIFFSVVEAYNFIQKNQLTHWELIGKKGKTVLLRYREEKKVE